MAIEKGEGVFNLGTGKTSSLLDVVNELKNLMHSNIETKITGDFRPGDNRHDFADISKLTYVGGEFGFVNLKEGLKKLVEWKVKEKFIYVS